MLLINKISVITTTVITLASCSTLALAKDQSTNPWLAEPVQTGPNLQVQVGFQSVDLEPNAANMSTVESFTTARAAFGYIFKHDYALELGYDSFVNSQEVGNLLEGPDHYKLYGTDLFVGKYFPVSQHFNMLVKVGGGLVHEDAYNLESKLDAAPVLDVKRTELMPAIGVSGQIQFARNIALSVGMTRFQKVKNIGSVNQYLVGVNWVL